jgi:hypothetical protein
MFVSIPVFSKHPAKFSLPVHPFTVQACSMRVSCCANSNRMAIQAKGEPRI